MVLDVEKNGFHKVMLHAHKKVLILIPEASNIGYIIPSQAGTHCFSLAQNSVGADFWFPTPGVGAVYLLHRWAEGLRGRFLFMGRCKQVWQKLQPGVAIDFSLVFGLTQAILKGGIKLQVLTFWSQEHHGTHGTSFSILSMECFFFGRFMWLSRGRY